MTKEITIEDQVLFLGEAWFDTLETGVRRPIRSFIERLLGAELQAALRRGRSDRRQGAVGYRHEYRGRQLAGTFEPVAMSLPRARLQAADGKTQERCNRMLPAYKRLTRQAEAPIAGAYLSGINIRRVHRVLAALLVLSALAPRVGLVSL